MEGLTVGRMVHYVAYGTPKGEYLPEHRAAVVTAVEDQENGIVSLAVLNPTGLFFNQHLKYDAEGASGTWHWIERA